MDGAGATSLYRGPMPALGLGRVKTPERGRSGRDGAARYSGHHHFDQRLGADNVHDAGQLVSEH